VNPKGKESVPHQSRNRSFSNLFETSQPIVSFEFFPPKAEEDLPRVKETLRRYAALNPAFMTVTYGAGGGTRHLTRDLTVFIEKELRVPAVAHLTCVGHSLDEIDAILEEYEQHGVHHILALRGDPNNDEGVFKPHPEGFSCARDLVAHIHERGVFSLAVAGYPEGHPEATTRHDELQYLREKIEMGGEIILTQLFFDAEAYFSFVKDARDVGITAPIVPGIMPIGNVKQLKRFTSMCGATIPEAIIGKLEDIAEDKEAVQDFGVQMAVELCTELLRGGAPGLHFYTLNKSKQVERIYRELRESEILVLG
jgi:methylenetetrahydrofolate reductase (NADPH)